jgi:hypothetical protein
VTSASLKDFGNFMNVLKNELIAGLVASEKSAVALWQRNSAAVSRHVDR